MSSAVKAVLHLLTNNAPLNEVVAASKIKPGIIPEKTALPAIEVSHVSTVRLHMVDATGTELCRSRVQVTAMAAKYSDVASIMALIRSALPRSRGTVDGVAIEGILHELDGPDFRDNEMGANLQTVDYMVHFTE